MAADAWATALMVLGLPEGAEAARRHKIEALFIERVGDDFSETRVGRLFAPHQAAGRPWGQERWTGCSTDQTPLMPAHTGIQLSSRGRLRWNKPMTPPAD
jgi:hypothetical protein